ncbi:dihydrolipoamide acetyltransferase family protein [Lutibaculum baratangense]|uniref:Dihydrolipoamide acetyltransferase component of pyruvate dehydrogenase complex n=1 Tax=Lutibaculum baratangense AMV1 TaxID=631454 RepID=V4RJG4_9HYPH|nr:dihydrolipoamide acetyltransferase family protein [Lutibaculum baratangense]ESR25464.1 Dihydrolipoamide acetyltransferase component (E2) of acetoin dehydrogenase complex [Lutibaculum baratangense AMV1]
MIQFRMPSLGADMDAGTLVEWYRKPGDQVSHGDIIALVETQKGAIEIEVFNDGTLDRIEVEPGHKVPVGTVLATIREPGEAASTALEPAAAAAPAPEVAPPTAPRPRPTAAPPPPAERVEGRAKVTPVARRRAAEAGIDLAAVAAGPDGVVGLAEVEAARRAAPETGAPAAAPRRIGIDLGEMRKAIAAAMSRSHRDIPHYWVSQTIDVTPLFDWLEAENARRPVASRLLYAAPLAKAMALALKETPQLNGHFVDDAFVPAGAVHLGVATALRGGGLVAPALHEVDTLSLDAVMAGLGDMIPRARSGRLRSSELTDATATLSNLGEGTSDAIMPLIYPPQVAIIGCGAAALRPWVADGVLAVRRVITVTVAGDHRVSDGRSASRFLTRLDALLQAPEAL